MTDIRVVTKNTLDNLKHGVKEGEHYKVKPRKAVAVTAYDYPSGCFYSAAGADWLLVGDSGLMTRSGYRNTREITNFASDDDLAMMVQILRTSWVRRGIEDSVLFWYRLMEENPENIRYLYEKPNKAFLVGDMPICSYEASDEDAIRNALRFIKAGADAVKLEGGANMADRVEAIAKRNVLVMGHIGLTPQSEAAFGGYRVQGKCTSRDKYDKILDDAKALESHGAFSILLEAMPPTPAQKIAQELKIPIYSIGAGHLTDGVLQISDDMAGTFVNIASGISPHFAKRYADGDKVFMQAFRDYRKDVIEQVYPGEMENYPE